jgi:hypothetical protein
MLKDKKGKTGDYEIGYGKPPKEHRFKKGKSGNPAGTHRSESVSRSRSRLQAEFGKCRLSRLPFAGWSNAD